jgi:signal transduction histidine kinase
MAHLNTLMLQNFSSLKKNVWSAITGEFLTSSALWTLILIFCCLILTTFIIYRSTKDLIGEKAWVLHTQEVLEQVLAISTIISAAESRQRGYLLTQDISYLDNFEESIRESNSHFKALKQLVTDNPVRVTEVQELLKLIEKRILILKEVLRTYKNEGAENAIQKLIHGDGLDVMSRITALTKKMVNEEKQLLKQRSLSSKSSEKFVLNSLIIGAIFNTALVFFSYYLLVNDLRRRQQNEKMLADARDNLEEKVRERTQELEQSNRDLQEFAYIASHDLQEPLRKIQVFGDRLKLKARDSLDETALDYLERMQISAKRMHDLINDLLQFSRVSNNKAEGFVEVDLNLVLKDVLSDLEGSVEHYGGEITGDRLPVLKANPLQIRQLLQNFLSNALKFHRPGIPPEVKVTWHNRAKFTAGKKTDDYYEIAISDNGIGIDPQYNDKIFIPFQRLHGKSEYGGTGIGLAICRKIIENHQGFIKVLPNSTGQGTQFLLGFPSSELIRSYTHKQPLIVTAQGDINP